MQKISLSAQLRDVATPLRDVRAARLVPAVVYGHKVAPISISLDASALLKAYRTAGKSHLLDLVVDGATHVAMMHDVQFHPVLGDIQHVDFFVVSATEKILVDLPVIFTGKSQAQLEGSTLQQNHTTLSVKVLPKDLIEAIDEIAERIRMLNEYVSATMGSYLKQSSIEEEIVTVSSGDKMLQSLVKDNLLIIDLLRNGIDQVSNTSDQGTLDFLINRLQYHEKILWMITSHL